MNPPIQLKRTTSLLLIVLGFVLLGLLPKAHAVSPAPDGGYPGANTAEGQNALLSLTTGGYNTAAGYLSLRNNTSGSFNTAVGAGTLLSNTGNQNTATGVGALLSNTTGFANTANGALALIYNNGDENTAIGSGALAQNTAGSNNIAVGLNAGSSVTTANNVICIGSNVAGNNVDNSCYVGNIFGATSASGVGVLVNTNGRLGTMTSSRRFKKDIKPLDNASEALLLLKPVSFRYKREVDPEGTSAVQFGLVAEEVEKVNPDLVVRDKEGKPYSVCYDQVNAMLLNEFLKEHRKVEQQRKSFEAAIARQQKQIDALTAGLQKVSAQLEMSKAAPQTVLNDQ
jgi:hypothetical protein